MRKFTKFFFFIILVFLVVSCNNKKESNNDIRLGLLKGPTSMGLSDLLIKNQNNELHNKYDVTLSSLPEEISTMFLKGELDIVSIPVNLASVLYNKSGHNAILLAINTEDAIYILKNKEYKVDTVNDLKGKKIYVTGKNAMPNVLIEGILNRENIDINSLDIEWKSDGTEVLQNSIQNPNSILILPEPYASIVLSKNHNFERAFNLSKEWYRVGYTPHTMISVIIANKEFYKNNKNVIKIFMEEFNNSINFINKDIESSSFNIDSLGIADKNVARLSIPNISFVAKYDKNDKEELKRFYDIIKNISPKFIGANPPEDDFYGEE